MQKSFSSTTVSANSHGTVQNSGVQQYQVPNLSALFDGVAMNERSGVNNSGALKQSGKANVIVSQLKGLQGEMSTLQDDI